MRRVKSYSGKRKKSQTQVELNQAEKAAEYA